MIGTLTLDFNPKIAFNPKVTSLTKSDMKRLILLNLTFALDLGIN